VGFYEGSNSNSTPKVQGLWERWQNQDLQHRPRAPLRPDSRHQGRHVLEVSDPGIDFMNFHVGRNKFFLNNRVKIENFVPKLLTINHNCGETLKM
jgi:hypothetical protein